MLASVTRASASISDILNVLHPILLNRLWIPTFEEEGKKERRKYQYVFSVLVQYNKNKVVILQSKYENLQSFVYV